MEPVAFAKVAIESDGSMNVTGRRSVHDLISVAQRLYAHSMARYAYNSARQLAQICIYPARNGVSAVDLDGEPAGCYCRV